MEQIRVCAQIGIECTDNNPAKRPVIQHIIDRLDETESIGGSIETSESNPLVLQVSSPTAPLIFLYLLYIFRS
jgi:hypothetical protein